MPPSGVLEALGHGLAGSTGTAFSTAAVYPLDLVTTRLKVQRQLKREDKLHEKDQYRGVFHALRAIMEQEGGIPALYMGLTQDIFKSITDSFLFFLFYTYFRDARRRARGRKLHAIEELAVGSLAGACARAFTTPIANVVTRKQMSALVDGQNEGESFSVRDILTKIRSENGVVGLWAGYSASLLLTINPSITFFLNDKLAKTLLSDSEETSQSAHTTFLLAAASKAIATIASYPLQTAKARLQIQGSVGSSPRRSIDYQGNASGKEKLCQSPRNPGFASEGGKPRDRFSILVNNSVLAIVLSIAKTEGMSALYAGIQGEVLKSFFSHGLTMVSKRIVHKFVIRLGISLVKLMQAESSNVIFQHLRRVPPRSQ